jgi:hypothetical protein
VRAAGVAALVALAACGGKKSNEPPVASASLSLGKDRVPIGSAVTLTYKFDVNPDAHFDRNYWVFVHVLDSEGEQMWTDDHLPPTPTTQWKPGQTIQYSRIVFVPNYPYIGEATVRLGLYDPKTNQRLALDAPDASRHEYVVAKFQVTPSSDAIYLIRKDGWYPAEVAAQNASAEWQWTAKTATVSFRNPKKDAQLYLQYDARPDLFPAPQQVTVRNGDTVIAQFPADAKMTTLKVIPITAAQLGTADMTTLSIEVDRTFVPGGADSRMLGIRVFHTYLDVK